MPMTDLTNICSWVSPRTQAAGMAAPTARLRRQRGRRERSSPSSLIISTPASLVPCCATREMNPGVMHDKSWDIE